MTAGDHWQERKRQAEHAALRWWRRTKGKRKRKTMRKRKRKRMMTVITEPMVRKMTRVRFCFG